VKTAGALGGSALHDPADVGPDGALARVLVKQDGVGSLPWC
jgi:hypothetical protein